MSKLLIFKGTGEKKHSVSGVLCCDPSTVGRRDRSPEGHAGLGEMAVREKNEKLRQPIKSRPGSQLEPVSTETPKVTKKERLCVSQAMGSQATGS